MTSEQAKLNYLRWLSRADPQMFAMGLSVADRALGDYDTLEGWADTIVNAVVTVGGAVLAKKQADAQLAMQKKQMQLDAQAADAARQDALRVTLLQTNMQRAQAGMPPIDINGNVIPSSQLPQLPATAATPAMMSTSGSIPSWVWLAGAGALALAFLS